MQEVGVDDLKEKKTEKATPRNKCSFGNPTFSNSTF